MFTIRRLVSRVVVPTVAVAALIIMPTAAMATSSDHGGFSPAVGAAQHPHVVRMSRHLLRPVGNRASAADTVCLVPRGAYVGGAICGTTTLDIWWNDGRQETFVVGTDHATWHIFQRYAGDPTWSGWYSLGGYANDGVWLWSLSPAAFYVFGADNSRWCNQSTPGQTASGWSGFYRC